MARMARKTTSNECRLCSTFCDRVIQPSSCVAAACPNLYEFDDPLSGRRYMGCLQKVFASEIDVRLFAEAERTRAGFGAVKLTGPPLRRCAFEVEQAYSSAASDRPSCSNRRFFDAPDSGPDAIRAFDLRNGLASA
jgi:hypothetical protein